MPNQYVFFKQLIDSLIGGVAAIDVKRLRIQNLNESYEFINAYGYNLNNEKIELSCGIFIDEPLPLFEKNSSTKMKKSQKH